MTLPPCIFDHFLLSLIGVSVYGAFCFAHLLNINLFKNIFKYLLYKYYSSRTSNLLTYVCNDPERFFSSLSLSLFQLKLIKILFPTLTFNFILTSAYI